MLLLLIQNSDVSVVGILNGSSTGSAPGPTLGNEYGKPLPFTIVRTIRNFDDSVS